LRLQIDAAGRIGFFHRATRVLVVPERCHVASDAVARTLEELGALPSRFGPALGAFASVEVRESESGVSLYFALKPEHAYPPVESEALLAKLKKSHAVVVEGRADRAPRERYRLGTDCYMYTAPGAFTQVNWPVNLALVKRVLEVARETNSLTFCDLYSGSGNFALPLARAGAKGVGVEVSAVAVEHARLAAKEQGLGDVRFLNDDAARYARRQAKSGQRFDLVLIDPPRSGVKKEIEAMARLAQRVIVMLSCDPVTFARDLARLTPLGWEFAGIEAFDMFPQTHHIESMAWLFPR
jgi:23S rRNA (uracil1939-C5)-methyltransferase